MILCTGGFAASSELVTRYIAPGGVAAAAREPVVEGDGLATRSTVARR